LLVNDIANAGTQMKTASAATTPHTYVCRLMNSPWTRLDPSAKCSRLWWRPAGHCRGRTGIRA
jgi:hypothetical protein